MTRARLAAALLASLTRLITGVRARWVTGGATAAQRVYYANHTSHLDTLVIWASLPPAMRAKTRPVAAADYWDRPGIRRWLACRVLNVLLVERGQGCGSREALFKIAEALKQGDSLILFPEGTRGDGTTLGEMKPGLYFVARQCPDVELVPVYLQNLSRILPKGEYLPVPIIGSAAFGAPLSLRAGEDRGLFLQRAREALLELGAQP
jgi:1-acyl-sn-glycerol-3-phosphate acyltransferase